MENEVYNEISHKTRGKGLKIHLLTYISVNLILLIINLAVGYQYPWHLWSVLGWGIFLGCHAGTHLAITQFGDSGSRGLAIHASAVISINLAVFGMNLLAGYSYPWHLWALIGLGLPWGIHGSVILSNRKFSEGTKIGLAIHVGVYIWVNLTLFFINLFTGPSNLWFLWPLLAWTIAFGIHTSVIYSIEHIQQYSVRGLVINGTVLGLIALFLFWIDLKGDHHLNWIWFAAIPLGLAWINHYIIYSIITPRFNKNISLFTKMQNKVINQIPTTVTTSKPLAFRHVWHRIAFWNHLIIYLLVNSFLVILNAINGGIMENPWSLITILSWGNAIVWHGYYIQIWKKRLYHKKITVFSTIGLLITVSISLILRYYLFGNRDHLNWLWLGIIIASVCWIILASCLSHLKPIQSSFRIHTNGYNGGDETQKHTVQSNSSEKFCPKCGERRDNSQNRFCEYCGQKFGLI
ncbi:hypothetical protein NEF87_004425 [Candidatus Lokiarchaeum ossiferum]|uniref:2TM domain-containing protein n=1 Tax=Candidatus Lokiarchaeum ossiferum TaxID=2951803 RepID=A0ABY6HXK1_9ARCH|nr:hypothetical protein NEF87_004425 [Candidatus Lokiarchaeum sp. B-35]